MDNLVKHQETIDFPMKIMGVSSNFSLKPVHWDIDWIIYIGIINGLPYGIMNRRFMGSILPIFLFDQQKSSVDQPTFGGDTSMCKLSASTTGWWCNNYVEKYDIVNGKDDIPSIWNGKFQECLKPPTRLYQHIITPARICYESSLPYEVARHVNLHYLALWSA